MLLYSFFQIYMLPLHTLLHISHLYFSTSVFLYIHICIFLYCHFFIIVYFHIFIHFCFCISFIFFIICVILYMNMGLTFCVRLCINVCMVGSCTCILCYLLWRVSYERQGMLTQWPAPDPMGWSIQSRLNIMF